MDHWLDLFTGVTWKQFIDAGSTISGFRISQAVRAQKVKPGDILICYLTGVMRWVGLLEVVSSSKDASPIWGKGNFPVRFQVRPLVMLAPEHGIPMRELEGRVSFYSEPRHWGGFRGFLRASLNRFNPEDAKLVASLIHAAKANPIVRPVDEKKLSKSPTTLSKGTKEAMVRQRHW